MTVQMGVAEKMDVNDEQTEFTFTVRDGVTWSDGTPLNANDFEWSWKRVLDPETKSEYTTALYPLKNAVKIDSGEDLDELGVKATDERTLVVTLEDRLRSSRSWPRPGPTIPCRATSSKIRRCVGRGRQDGLQRSLCPDRLGTRPEHDAGAQRELLRGGADHHPSRLHPL